MTQPGMVHALEKIHGLIQPGGLLIDVHPSSDPAEIVVRARDQLTRAGWIDETDDYVEYEWADEALRQVVDRGLFALAHHGAFEFVWHADSLADLRAYLAEEWNDAAIDPVTAMRVEEMLKTPERDKEILVRKTIYIARFSRI
jgi:hypothetical protein